MFDDPFPSPDELMQRSATLDLMHLLTLFVRSHEGSSRTEQHEAAMKLAVQIFEGFSVFTDHARDRLRNAEAALHDIQFAMPPAPVVVGDKIATYCPPEEEQRHMYGLMRLALDRYAKAQAASRPSNVPSKENDA